MASKTPPPTIDSFRRAALFLATAVREEHLESVLFSSPRGREGATTSVLNIARELKDSFGIRPLVVELNRGRPALCRLFRLDREKTIEAIDGDTTARACVQRTPQGLEVIPASDRKRDARRPFRIDETLRRILDEVRQSYDLVLADAPPVLDRADAIIAGDIVPRMMLVVRAGRTRYEMIDRIRRDLSSRNITILGAILNRHRRFVPAWIYRIITG